jgi:hypothetical protein
VLVLCFVAFYITAAWDVWWYGGRAMVQYYPVFAFPLVALLEWVGTKQWLKYLMIVLLAASVYLNIWWTYHAHGGSLLHIEQMTKPFYWRVVGRWTAPEDVQKLLDTDAIFEGERSNVKLLYSNDFEQDNTALTGGSIIQGLRSGKVDKQDIYSPAFTIPFSQNDADWIRAWGTFSISQKEWEVWKMPQFILKFKKDGNEVKASMMRLHRYLYDGQTRRMYLDVPVPDKEIDSIEVFIWNADTDKQTWFDEISIESFDEG